MMSLRLHTGSPEGWLIPSSAAIQHWSQLFAVPFRAERWLPGLARQGLAEKAQVSARFVSFREIGRRHHCLIVLAAVEEGWWPMFERCEWKSGGSILPFSVKERLRFMRVFSHKHAERRTTARTDPAPDGSPCRQDRTRRRQACPQNRADGRQALAKAVKATRETGFKLPDRVDFDRIRQLERQSGAAGWLLLS
jgi:hypothetical protein